MELQLRPELAAHIRVVESIGPFPIPPVVVSSRLPAAKKDRLRPIFLTTHERPKGKAVLADGLIARFVEAQGADYDPLPQTVRRAEAAGSMELK